MGLAMIDVRIVPACSLDALRRISDLEKTKTEFEVVAQKVSAPE